VLVYHDASVFELDSAPIQKYDDVVVINTKIQPRRGRFSLVQCYLDAVNWLFHHHIDFDWLCNLSGQDYPIQPLSEIEEYLFTTSYDGFIEYFDALSTENSSLWQHQEGISRYFYQYRWLFDVSTDWLRTLSKPVKIIVNHGQTFLKIQTTYGIAVGVRANPSPFDSDLICYVGSDFKTLSKKCVQFIYETFKENGSLVEYYRKTCLPEESFVQTILVNSKKFNLLNDNKRFIKWGNQSQGHPQLLVTTDYLSLTKTDAHFARKFDCNKDSNILDLLDCKILS
jgi:hypothetical protein